LKRGLNKYINLYKYLNIFFKMKDENCIFCKIIKKEIPADIVYEDDNMIAFLDAKPKSPGHTLIVPKKHFKTILDIPDTFGVDIMKAAKKVALKMIKEGKADGFNFNMNNYPSAGQVVHHAHYHLLPRKTGDGLKDKLLFD